MHARIVKGQHSRPILHPSEGFRHSTVEHLQQWQPNAIELRQQTIPTALRPHHQPKQRVSACQENPSLSALGAMSLQQQQSHTYHQTTEW